MGRRPRSRSQPAPVVQSRSASGKRRRGKGSWRTLDLSALGNPGWVLHNVGPHKVAIKSVLAGGAADRAGLRAGMRLFRVGAVPVSSQIVARETVEAYVGSVVRVSVSDDVGLDGEGGDQAMVEEEVAELPDMEVDDAGLAAPPATEDEQMLGCPCLGCPLRDMPPPDWRVGPAMPFPRTLRRHVEDHILRDPGLVQQLRDEEWFSRCGLEVCVECGFLLEGVRGSVHTGECARRHADRCCPPRAALLPGVDEDELELPSLMEICAVQVNMRSTVPASLRQQWNRALHLSLSEAALYNVPDPDAGTAEGRRCLRAWSELLMLAKATLCSPPRAGEKRKRQALQYTRNRLEAWLRGSRERLELWRTLPTQNRGDRRRTDPASDVARERRASKLAADGRLGEAFKALSSPTPLPPDADRLERMRAKHPKPLRPPGAGRHGPAPPTWEVEWEEIQEQLRRFPRGTAAGPSGLAVQHILDACRVWHGESLSVSLTGFINLLVRGDAPAVIARHFAGARLVALPKFCSKSGQLVDLRPVAVGESLRRLAGKVLCARAKSTVTVLLQGVKQFGVGIPGGGEAIVHAVRQWHTRQQESDDAVALLLDFTNAFNQVERDVILSECRRELPEVSAFVEWCYGEETVLLYGEHPVASSTGVQQGDPLGPLLFCLALRSLLLDAQAQDPPMLPEFGPSFTPSFFLDDGVLCGEAQQVKQALDAILELGPALGFDLNLEKCKLLNVGRSLPPPDLFPQEVERVTEVELLKSPIGGERYCEETVLAKVESLRGGLLRLSRMEDAHTAFRILAVCCGAGKMMYQARTTPPSAIRGALAEFDSMVRRAFESVVGSALAEEEWTQATLGTAHGGLGLRRIGDHAAAAYVSSRAATFGCCKMANAEFCWEAGEEGTALALAIEELRSLGVPLPQDVTLRVPDGKKQASLSREIDARRLQELLSVLDVRGQARIRSCSVPHAAAWATASPAPGLRLHLLAPLFQVAVRLWLGAPVGPAGTCACGAALDSNGVHALTCKLGGWPVRRHNRLRDLLYEWCNRAGLQPELEKLGILPGSRERPADVACSRWPGGGMALVALDQAVVSPLKEDCVDAAARECLVAASMHADRKANREETERRCREKGVRYVPMVVETFGAWCAESRQTIQQIAGLAPTFEGTRPEDAVRLCFQQLSIELMRTNAQAIIDRYQAASVGKPTLREGARRDVARLRSEADMPGMSPRAVPSIVRTTHIDSRVPFHLQTRPLTGSPRFSPHSAQVPDPLPSPRPLPPPYFVEHSPQAPTLLLESPSVTP